MGETKLQRKLVCRVLLPMVIGMIITLLMAYIPFYLSFPTWIDSITSDMIDDRKVTLKTLCTYLSNCAASAMNYPINFLLLSLELYNDYYNGKIAIKPSWSPLSNFVNAYQFQISSIPPPYGFETTTNRSFDTSMWYLQEIYFINEIKDPITNQEFIDCSVFDFFIQPILKVGNPNSNVSFFQRSLTGFNYDGLVYANPTEYQIYYKEYTDTMNCTYEINRAKPVYDPRCRPWFQQTSNSTDHDTITITEPYVFADNINVGQTFCVGNWQEKGFHFASCIDYGMSEMSSYIDVIDSGSTTYAFAVSPGGKTFVHPGFDGICNSDDPSSKCLGSIVNVEMSDADSSEKAQFEKDILPKFSENQTSIGKYSINGKNIIIAISPVYTFVSSDKSPKIVATIGLRLEESTMTDPFDKLKDSLNQLLYIEGVALFLLIAIILVICWLLTSYVTQQIIKPIDNLVQILNRLNDGDVDINIEEHYQDCSKELTHLYTVFTKLKIVLRFGKSHYFSEDSEAVMNYAQALTLFLEYRNMEGAGICYNNLGIIHYRNLRYQEAAECFEKALRAAESLKNRPELVTKRKFMLATTFLAWKKNDKKATELMLEVVDQYKQIRDHTQTIECLLIIAENAIKTKGVTEGYLEEAENILVKAVHLKIPKDIILGKITYCRGLFLMKKGLLREACSYFISALIDNDIYDAETRKKCLEELRFIYKKFSVGTETLDLFLQDYNDQAKDVVFLVDYSKSMNGTRIQKSISLVNNTIEHYIKPEDRLAYIVFNQVSKIIFNLTPRGQESEYLQSEVKKYELPVGGTAFYDAIYIALQEFLAYHVSEDRCVPFDVQEVKKENRGKWILAVIDGEDNVSTHSYGQIKRKLAKSLVNLVIIGLGLPKAYQDLLSALCETTSKGLFISTSHISGLEQSFQTFSLLISSKNPRVDSLD